jgi:hypothetical protein
MKNSKHMVRLVGVFGLMVLTSACGAQSYSSGAAGTSSSVIPTPVATVTPAPIPIPTSTPSTLPPETYSFTVTGPNGSVKSQTFPAVSTDSTLKVTVITNSSGSVQGSNQSVGYNCVQYTVTVKPQGSSSAGWSKQVLVSTTGSTGTGYCQGAQPQPTVDFSSYMTQGHGAMEVSIGATNSDNCRKYYFSTGSGYVYGVGWGGCPMDVIYSTYNVVGTVQIHTNGTL